MQIGMWNILPDKSAIAQLEGKGEHKGDIMIVSVKWEEPGFDSQAVFENAVKGTPGETVVVGVENNKQAGYYARVLFNGSPQMMGGFNMDGECTIEDFASEMSPIDVVNAILEHGK